MKLKCLIIDDEPMARQILQRYCSYFLDIEVVGSCQSALEAKRILSESKVNLIFIDINMPVLDGISFVRTLKSSPHVIFTTAYKEFAHEAFELSACDYLLKPFSLERFIIAVDKVKSKILPVNNVYTELEVVNFTYFKSEGKIYKINFEDIYFAEANGNNVKVVTKTGIIKLKSTFEAIESLLIKPNFVRVHRSFIINKNKIDHIEGNRVLIDSIEIPIGANYREHFLRELGIK